MSVKNLMNALISYHSKKVRYKIDSYIFHMVLLAIILLSKITIVSYHYAKHSSKLKHVLPCYQYKMENNEF